MLVPFAQHGHRFLVDCLADLSALASARVEIQLEMCVSAVAVRQLRLVEGCLEQSIVALLAGFMGYLHSSLLRSMRSSFKGA